MGSRKYTQGSQSGTRMVQIALFRDNCTCLHYNTIQRGHEAIIIFARKCLALGVQFHCNANVEYYRHKVMSSDDTDDILFTRTDDILFTRTDDILFRLGARARAPSLNRAIVNNKNKK